MLLPFGEWKPDISDYEGQTTEDIVNAVPHADGYGPFLSLTAATTALPAACRGTFYALRDDGTISIFAATSTNLYLLDNTNSAWTNVSLSGGPYTTLADDRNWSFCQFNNYVFATQGNVALQVYDLTSSSTFTAALGSPPQADFVCVINRFLVLSGLASPNVYRVQWSGLNSVNASTSWDNVTDLSNYQDMADGGLVRGVVGGDVGTIFQDQSIRRMVFQPGSSLIFGIDRITANDGLLAPYSLIAAGNQIFWLSPTGFKSMLPGLYPQPIGKERVDRTFNLDVDKANLQLMIGSADPNYPRVYWAYKSSGGFSGLFDKIICYDYVLDRWSLLEIVGEYICPLAQPGLTLEGVDAAYGIIAANWTNLTSISNASPAVLTFSGSPPANGQGIQLQSSGGTLPAGLTTSTPYYVINASTHTCNVSTTGGVGAYAGSAVNTSSAGSGTFQYQSISIDDLSIGSLDTISTGQLPFIAAFDNTHTQGYFNGPALEATLVSSEHGAAPKRVRITGFRPITDASGVYGSSEIRETLEGSPVLTNEQQVNAIGMVNQRATARYVRPRLRIPEGTTWTFATGVEIDAGVEGLR